MVEDGAGTGGPGQDTGSSVFPILRFRYSLIPRGRDFVQTMHLVFENRCSRRTGGVSDFSQAHVNHGGEKFIGMQVLGITEKTDDAYGDVYGGRKDRAVVRKRCRTRPPDIHVLSDKAE